MPKHPAKPARPARPARKAWAVQITLTTPDTRPPVVTEWPERFDYKRDARSTAARILLVAQQLPVDLYLTVDVVKRPPIAVDVRDALLTLVRDL